VFDGVGPAPVICEEAVATILGQRLSEERIGEAADRAARCAKPLDNTDQVSMWRKKVVRVEVKRALLALDLERAGGRSGSAQGNR